MEEAVIKKRGENKMFDSFTCENVGSNILRKAKNMFRHVGLSDLHSVSLHGTTRLHLD